MQTDVVTSGGHCYEDFREPSIAGSISVTISHSTIFKPIRIPGRTSQPELTKTMEKAKAAVSSFIGRAGHHDTVRQTFLYRESNWNG
jgi:hypothetical protein